MQTKHTQIKVNFNDFSEYIKISDESFPCNSANYSAYGEIEVEGLEGHEQIYLKGGAPLFLFSQSNSEKKTKLISVPNQNKSSVPFQIWLNKKAIINYSGNGSEKIILKIRGKEYRFNSDQEEERLELRIDIQFLPVEPELKVKVELFDKNVQNAIRLHPGGYSELGTVSFSLNSPIQFTEPIKEKIDGLLKSSQDDSELPLYFAPFTDKDFNEGKVFFSAKIEYR